VEGGIKTLSSKFFPDIEDSLRMTPDDLGNLAVRFIGVKQDVGVTDCGSSRFPAVNDIVEDRTLIVGKMNGVLDLPHDNIFGLLNINTIIIIRDMLH
jgi:hypothetical protein